MRTEEISEETVTENFPNFVKTLNAQIQEAQQTPNRKKTALRSLITQIAQNQWQRKRNVEGHLTHIGTKTRMTASYFMLIMNLNKAVKAKQI